ncbi:MFS transporter [Sphaerimonospora cavernae]|uniref:MFS transporter n=1 Tax=Sphaerimonospora cavernae TaxID=1740611 RepID=A0ABV6UDD1_9ACTN
MTEAPHDTTEVRTPPLSGRTGRSGSSGRWRERAVLAALIMLASSTAVVASLGAPLVPRIAEAEGVSLGNAQWVLTVTFLAGAVTAPLIGRAGSGRHRRPVILAGLAVVVLGSVLAALPLGFGAMLLGRVMQGLGLSLTPLAIAIARDILPAGRREAAIATLSLTTVTGAGLGYPIASLIVSHFGVAAAYWCGALLSALTLLACALTIPRHHEREDGRLDLLGAALLGGGAGTLLLVISQVHDWGVRSAVTPAMTAAAVLLLGVWAWWTLRVVGRPLVDLRLALRPGVLGANVTALLAGCGMYMMVTIAVLLVQAPTGTGYGLGYSVVMAGMMLVPYSIASVLGSKASPWLLRFISPDQLLPLGCLWFMLGALSMACFRTQLWQLLLSMLISGFGSGCSFAAMPGLIVRFVPPKETGSAMSFNMILRYLGFSTGSTLVLTILQLFSAPSGALTDGGFTAAALSAAGVSGLAAVVAFWLGRAVPAVSNG